MSLYVVSRRQEQSLHSKLVRRCAAFVNPVFRVLQALSSALAALGTLQPPRAFGTLKSVDPSEAAPNYYYVGTIAIFKIRLVRFTNGCLVTNSRYILDQLVVANYRGQVPRPRCIQHSLRSGRYSFKTTLADPKSGSSSRQDETRFSYYTINPHSFRK